MLNELLEILVSFLPARRKSLGSEMRHYRRQQQKRRRMLSDTEREELIARWTARTRPGERPATKQRSRPMDKQDVIEEMLKSLQSTVSTISRTIAVLDARLTAIEEASGSRKESDAV